MNKLSRKLYSADPDLLSSAPTSSTTSSEDPSALMTRLEENLQEHEQHFNRLLKILIDTLNYYAATETVTLLGLCARLMAAEEGAGRKERESFGGIV